MSNNRFFPCNLVGPSVISFNMHILEASSKLHRTKYIEIIWNSYQLISMDCIYRSHVFLSFSSVPLVPQKIRDIIKDSPKQLRLSFGRSFFSSPVQNQIECQNMWRVSDFCNRYDIILTKWSPEHNIPQIWFPLASMNHNLEDENYFIFSVRSDCTQCRILKKKKINVLILWTQIFKRHHRN